MTDAVGDTKPSDFADVGPPIGARAVHESTSNLSFHGRIVLGVAPGLVRTCRSLNDGRRIIDARHARGDVFGFESGSAYSLSTEAVCECNIIAYARRRLEQHASIDVAISEQVLSYALRTLARSQAHALLLARRSAQARIAAFLIERAELSKHHSTFDLERDRQDIADYLALTVETVSRTFSHFERTLRIELPTCRRIHIRNTAGLRRLNA